VPSSGSQEKPKILIIDDDYSVVASLSLLLRRAGYEAVTAETPQAALQAVAEPQVQLALQDMNFSRRTSGEEGLHLLRELQAIRPGLPVILMTAWGSIELAVEGMKRGAVDFATKPWSNDQILHSVETALGLASAQVDAVRGRAGRSSAAVPSREELARRYDFTGIVGEDPQLRRMLELVGRVAATDASILITGDSGTGKELIAEAIHRNSRRRGAALIKVNLGGIPAALFESEMFGHVKGAFTDARQDRDGRFATADGGTIFLDEVGEVDPGCQVKLLRVLQERTYEVLGSSTTRRVDVRVISATNNDLNQAVTDGRFREDLLYRLNLITIRLPSLAERRGDIALIAGAFLEDLRVTYGRSNLQLADATLAWLSGLDWPGNIRQLRHVIERSVLVSDGAILQVENVQPMLQMDHERDVEGQLPPVGSVTMEELEKAMIDKSLRFHQGNLSRVAESLGMSRAALYRRLERYGLRA
jgi:DNA-binding NtrC family response regulator